MATTDTARCDRCDRSSARLIPAYWGEALCPDCCQLAATGHDLVGWPPFRPNEQESGQTVSNYPGDHPPS